MFNNAFKSLLRVLKENGFPYKCRLYGNSQQIAIQWFCITECSNILCAKNQLCYFRGKHRLLFYEIRWSGLQPITHHDETKKRAHDSQTARAKENLKLSHGRAQIPNATYQVPRPLAFWFQRRRYLKGFDLIWAWWPSWSCDHKQSPYKI